MSKPLKHGNRTGLKYFSYTDIQSWGPCYDSKKHIPETWRGTAIGILKMEQVPFADRLWCVLRPEIVSERVMRLFAVWSYRQTLKFVTNPDPRSLEAADVAERFANGYANRAELESAWSAAYSAAWSAAESAAWSAAYSAAESAAYSAAESAAWSEAAAESALARSAQRDKLIEMILVEGQELIKLKKGT